MPIASSARTTSARGSISSEEGGGRGAPATLGVKVAVEVGQVPPDEGGLRHACPGELQHDR
jgi:hypothetical protein